MDFAKHIPIVGLPIKAGMFGYKMYKQHKAEREMHMRGERQEIVDPSYELETCSIPVPYQSGQSRSHSESDRLRRSMSTSSHSSASSSEVEAQLEQDLEFQRFMQRQKQVYLDQQRAIRELGRVTTSEFVPESHPPTYDTVMAQYGTVGSPAPGVERPPSNSYQRSAVSRLSGSDPSSSRSPIPFTEFVNSLPSGRSSEKRSYAV